jgi:hypothetical protein
MIRRLLATVALSAVLLLSTVIALEAVGRLFQEESPEPAVLNVDVGEVPEETAPARLWKQLDELEAAKAEAERKEVERKEAEREEAARQAAEERKRAEAVRLAEEERGRPRVEVKVATLGPPPVGDAPWQADVKPAPGQAHRTHEVKLAATVAAQQSKRMPQRLSQRDRARPVRGAYRRTKTARCPFLAWLETMMAPSAPRRGAT